MQITNPKYHKQVASSPVNTMVLYTLLTIFFTLQGALCGYSQDKSFKTLPLVYSPDGADFAVKSSEDSEEYKSALRVYEKLIQVRGDYRVPVPKFSLVNSVRNVAYVDYDNLEVVLEKKALDVCKKFGAQQEAAIAFLLGHELTHYYEKHAWRREFIYYYKDLPIGQELADLKDDVVHETEADYLGGFLAYTAGYGLFDKGAELINLLYNEYNLPSSIEGYPSLQDRITLAGRSAKKLNSLVDLFEMGNMLHSIGLYEDALSYYMYVLLQYPSRELYNNIGATAIMCALKLFKKEELTYKFFTELDIESTASRGKAETDLRTNYLKQAILQLDVAISLDPSYAPAYFNKAVAYALLGDYKRSRFYAEVESLSKAESGVYLKTAADTRILLAIIDDIEGNTTKAVAALEKLSAGGNIMAKMNLDIIKGNTKQIANSAYKSVAAMKSLDMDKVALALETGDELPLDDLEEVKLEKNFSFFTGSSEEGGFVLKLAQIHEPDPLEKSNLVVLSPIMKDKLKLGTLITNGDHKDLIIQKFGFPNQISETPNGQLFVYQETPKDANDIRGLILEIDAGGNLKKWHYFRKLLN